MATSSQKRKGLLASAAGLAPKQNAEPKFTVTVSGNIGPFAQGDVLSTKQQIVAYYRAILNEGADTETTLSDDQIYAAIQVVSIAGMEGDLDAIDEARQSYLETIETTAHAPLTDLQKDTLFATNTIMAAAKTLGQRADAELEEAVQVAIEGKLDWNGSPLVIVGHLERLYGADILSEFPPVNSRRTGKRNDKGEYHKDEVPDGYNGRTDYFYVDVEGKQKLMRFTQVFVESMEPVDVLLKKKSMIKTLMSPTWSDVKTVPEDLAKLVSGATPDLAGLQGKMDDITMQISSHVNRIAQGLALWQVQQKFNELEKIDWEYVDGTAEATARRTKPIQLYALEAMVDKKGKEVTTKTPAPKPIALSGFIRLAKFIPQCKMAGGQLKTLLALDIASRKKEPQTPAVANTNNTMPAIENIDQFTTALTTTYNYLDRNESSIRLALQTPSKAGEVAMWLLYVSDKIDAYFTDNAIREIALKHDQGIRNAVAKAMGEGTKAA